MELYTVEHHWQNRESAESVVLGVYTTHEAAWQAMRDIAIDMGATDAPATPQHSIDLGFNEHSFEVATGEDLVLVTATLDGEGAAIPRRVFFFEQWRPELGHYREQYYSNRQTAISACQDLAVHLDRNSDSDLFRISCQGGGRFSQTCRYDGREIWRTRVASEPVRAEAVTIPDDLMAHIQQ